MEKAAGDSLGHGVSMSADGSRVAIGAPGNAFAVGHVRVYDWNDSVWVQVGSDIEGKKAGDLFGLSTSLSADGNRLAISTHSFDSIGDRSGFTRIYDWNNGDWIQVGEDLDGEYLPVNYSRSISLSADGSHVAIGTESYARVFTWSDSSWIQVGNNINGEALGDWSGRWISLSADGGQIAIGAPYNDGNGFNSGHVRVYSWADTSWVQVGADIDGERVDDRSGWSVSLSADGNRVAIGAPFHVTDERAGHVRVYDWNDTTWTQVGADIDGEGLYDVSGWPVSLSANGNRLAISAIQNDGNGDNSGHVRIYDWIDTAWVQSGIDIDGEAAGDNSGWGVSLSADGSHVAIGAPSNDGNGINAGQVRIYELFPMPSTAIEPVLSIAHSFDHIFPNPASHTTTFGFFLETPGIVSVKVYNVMGQLIEEKHTHGIRGENEIDWDVSQMAAGMYHVVLAYKEIKLTRKLIVRK